MALCGWHSGLDDVVEKRYSWCGAQYVGRVDGYSVGARSRLGTQLREADRLPSPGRQRQHTAAEVAPIGNVDVAVAVHRHTSGVVKVGEA